MTPHADISQRACVMPNPPLTPTAAIEALERLVRKARTVSPRLGNQDEIDNDASAVHAALSTLPAEGPVAWWIEIQETDGTWHFIDVCAIPQARDAELRRLADRDIPARVIPLYRAPADQQEGS